METPARKAINFDLDTKKMAAVMGDFTKGYHALERSFKKVEFEHDQGSGYISKGNITNWDASKAVEKVVHENPWLPDCARRFRITEPTVLYEGELLLDKIGSQMARTSEAAATDASQAAAAPSPTLAAMRAGFRPQVKTSVDVASAEDKIVKE